MKACVLTGLNRMEIRDVPMPRIAGRADVLIRMEAIGVCGSDVHYYRTGKIGSQVVSYPFAVGHECAGTVVEVGKSVRRVRPGVRVAVEPARSCGRCDQCRKGRHHTCRKICFLGCPGQAEGCLMEYIVMAEECCFPVRKGFPAERAALVEPMSIGIYSARQAPPLKGARVGILGSGPIGLCILLAARAEGARRIWVTDPIPERRTVARRLGATWTGDPRPPAAVQEILARAPLGLDVVFECCGQQEAINQGIELLTPGGTLVVVGIPSVDRVSFSADLCRRKEIAIRNIRRQVGCVPAAVSLLQRQSALAGRMVTHRFPLERTPDAFELAARYGDGIVKAMIVF